MFIHLRKNELSRVNNYCDLKPIDCYPDINLCSNHKQTQKSSNYLLRCHEMSQFFSSRLLNNSRLISNSKRYFMKRSSSEPDPVQLSFKVYEDTPPLLIFHGLYGSKSNFNTVARNIHHRTWPIRRVVSADLRNHGSSEHSSKHTFEAMAQDIKALLHRLGIKKVALLGHSLGGKSVLYFSLKYPELVDRLIVEDICHVTHMGIENIVDTFEIMRNVKMPKNVTHGEAMMIIGKQLKEDITNRWYRTFLLTNVKRKPTGEFYWRVNIDGLLQNAEDLVSFPDVSKMTYTGHVLFIAGTDSTYLDPSDIPEIKKLCPKAEIRFVEGAGHLIHVDAPVVFENMCVEFLNRDLSR